MEVPILKQHFDDNSVWNWPMISKHRLLTVSDIINYPNFMWDYQAMSENSSDFGAKHYTKNILQDYFPSDITQIICKYSLLYYDPFYYINDLHH